MCEREYVGCAQCGAPTSEVTFYHVQSVTEHASLNESGDIYEWNGDSEYSDAHDSGYECASCGHVATSLDEACIDDECDCRECYPADHLEEPEDEDEYVSITRVNLFSRAVLDPDLAPELLALNEDKALLSLPIRAGRLAEISDQLDRASVEANLSPVPDWQVQNAMPEPEEAIAA